MNIDYTNWKLTLPSADEVMNPELSANSEKYLPTAGTLFRCPVNGSTTPNSGYPRMELREMNGSEKASWSTLSGIHKMYFEGAITAVPLAKPHVVCCQIHDANDDVLMIRLEFPILFIEVGGNNVHTLDSNYVLGKKFSIEMVAGKNLQGSSEGEISVYYNGALAKSFKNEDNGLYFKAGCYTQSNCEKETKCDVTNYGEVAINKLTITHEEAPAPPLVTVAKIANQLDYPNVFFGTKHKTRVSLYGCKLCCIKYLYDVSFKANIKLEELDLKLIAGGCYFGMNGDLLDDVAVCRLFGWEYLGLEKNINKPPTWSPTIKEVDFSAAPGKNQHFTIRCADSSGKYILDPIGGVRRAINYYEVKVGAPNWESGYFSYRKFMIG